MVVDVQRGFGYRAESPILRGLQPSEKAETRLSADLVRKVYDGGGHVVVTQDWHNRPGTVLTDPATGQNVVDDRSIAEFDQWGAHCIPGTGDARLNGPLKTVVKAIEKQEGHKRGIIPVDGLDTTGRDGLPRLTAVHKNTYNVTRRLDVRDPSTAVPNQAFIDLIRSQVQGAHGEPVDTVLVTGKIAEVCVKAAATSLHELFPDLRIVVLEDAVSSLSPESKAAALKEIQDAGVEVARVSDVLP